MELNEQEEIIDNPIPRPSLNLKLKQQHQKPKKEFPKIKLPQKELTALIEEINLYLLESKNETSSNSHSITISFSPKAKLTKLFKSKITIDNTSPNEIDIEFITQIISQSTEHSIQFVDNLNLMRGKLIIMKVPQFEFVVSVFMKILDRFLHKSKLKDKHFTILDSIVILSQTFYCEKLISDALMANIIGLHSIWHGNLWYSLIKRFIKKEKKRQKQLGMRFDHDKEMTMIMSTLITYRFTMKNFHRNEELYVIENLGTEYGVVIPED